MKRLVLIDGNALLHRAYHATPPLTSPQGELINAVYGFSSMLLKVISDLEPDFLAVAWDLKAPTFRQAHFKEYKAQRKPTDESLSSQYEKVAEVLQAFNIPQFSLPGYEADDLVGALAKQAEKKEKALEIIITTGDRDIMQLIDKRIKIFMPRKTLSDVGMYGEEEFAARFGFAPKNLVDYKALAGDQSDNIPGVTGIGEVTATKLIQKYGSLEKIYQDLKKLPEKLQQLLKEGKEAAKMSKQLATLETEIPIKLDLLACRVHDFDREKVIKLFGELGFRSLIGRIPGAAHLRGGVCPPAGGAHLGGVTGELDLEVTPILQRMSDVGILLDLKFLKQFGAELKAKLLKIEQDIYSKIGHELNLNSPRQLSVVLFDELNLPVVKKTKTGRSTDEDTLRELTSAHPAIPLILEYRQLFKLISTYLDALPKYVGKDGRVHSTFNVEGAATGRLSSQDPNLQNIPIKGQLGGEVRRAFIAPKGKILLGTDYSQIELRIMAHLADDPGLKKAFLEGLDIHAATAAKIFDVPLDKVTKEQRMVGKTMNFATLYGQGAHALSRQLGVKYEVARQYIEEYFAEFPKIKVWMEKVLREAREKGYAQTLWGRKRYLPELKATNRMIQAFGERAAVNHPVQGTAADMIKKAMVEIDKELVGSQFMVHSKKKNDERTNELTNNCQLILQVHDELLFECDGSASSPQVQKVAKMVKGKMENALKLFVPVLVDLKVGQNWGEMKPIKV